MSNTRNILRSTENEIKSIKEQIVSHYAPIKVVLFGSQAKGTATKNSDIDICIIKDTANKRDLLADMYLNIESSKPFDLILYTEDEWDRCIIDTTSFAYQINNNGIILFER